MERQESAETQGGVQMIISPSQLKEVPWKLTAAGEVPASEAQNQAGGNVNISISGGTVKAVGGQGSAGIGIGYNSWAKSRITITGGRTDARGGSRSSGENTTSGVGAGSKMMMWSFY